MAHGDQRGLDPIIRLPEVVELTGLSRSSIYRMATEGRFPAPLKLGARSSGWRASSIAQWIESRQPAGDRGATA